MSCAGRIVVGAPGEPTGSCSSQTERSKLPPGAVFGFRGPPPLDPPSVPPDDEPDEEPDDEPVGDPDDDPLPDDEPVPEDDPEPDDDPVWPDDDPVPDDEPAPEDDPLPEEEPAPEEPEDEPELLELSTPESPPMHATSAQAEMAAAHRERRRAVRGRRVECSIDGRFSTKRATRTPPLEHARGARPPRFPRRSGVRRRAPRDAHAGGQEQPP